MLDNLVKDYFDHFRDLKIRLTTRDQVQEIFSESSCSDVYTREEVIEAVEKYKRENKIKTPKSVFIYNQNSVQAGKICCDVDNWEDTSEYTELESKDMAEELKKMNVKTPAQLYRWKVLKAVVSYFEEE